MDDEMSFVEGAYRLDGGDWQVFIFSRRDVDKPAITDSTWASGVTGLHVAFPRQTTLNQTVVESLLGDHLGVDAWSVVRGPDSMVLR